MRLFVVSDLHNEFDVFVPPEVSADAVVLAGDIDVGIRAPSWARDTFAAPVLYVAGNHEFYKSTWQGLLPRLKAEADRCGIHFLENRMVVLDGVRFLGTTLWTDFALFGEERIQECFAGAKVMMDFRLIDWQPTNEPARKFTPPDSVWIHGHALAWLTQSLATPFQGKTVVITHHLPHWNSVAPRWQNELSSAGFASDLHALIERYQPALWIHGHTHDSFDYYVGDTRIVCNPRGYVRHGERENQDFQESFVVEI